MKKASFPSDAIELAWVEKQKALLKRKEKKRRLSLEEKKGGLL